MSNFKKLLAGLTGQGSQMTRREFLRGAATGAAMAALPVKAIPKKAASGKPPSSLMAMFHEGFKGPHSQLQITAVGGDAVIGGDIDLGNLNGKQLADVQMWLEEAQRNLPNGGVTEPAVWNRGTKQWHKLSEVPGLNYVAPPGAFQSDLNPNPIAQGVPNQTELDNIKEEGLTLRDMHPTHSHYHKENLMQAWRVEREPFAYDLMKREKDPRRLDKQVREDLISFGNKLGSNRREMSPQQLQTNPSDLTGLQSALLDGDPVEPRGRASKSPIPTRQDAIRLLRGNLPSVIAAGSVLSGLSGGEK